MKIERSPDEKAHIDVLQARFQQQRPSLRNLVASREFEPPISQGEHFDMVKMLVALRAACESAGLDRETVAARMGVESALLARIETGNDDPTMMLLRQYAAALGKQIVLTLADPQTASADSVHLG